MMDIGIGSNTSIYVQRLRGEWAQLRRGEGAGYFSVSVLTRMESDRVHGDDPVVSIRA